MQLIPTWFRGWAKTGCSSPASIRYPQPKEIGSLPELALPVRLVPLRIQGVVDDARLSELGAAEDDVHEGVGDVFVVDLKEDEIFQKKSQKSILSQLKGDKTTIESTMRCG